MQLSLFQDPVPEADYAALEACLRAEVVALDVETETRWPGHGPHAVFGLRYSADLTLIALGWPDIG
jgi:hypothetical protein